VTDIFQEPIGATDLSPTEREGLLQTWITTRAELNVAEAENILDGATWARRRRGFEIVNLLTDESVKHFTSRCLAMSGVGQEHIGKEKVTSVMSNHIGSQSKCEHCSTTLATG
jgi:hypothetical protein